MGGTCWHNWNTPEKHINFASIAFSKEQILLHFELKANKKQLQTVYQLYIHIFAESAEDHYKQHRYYSPYPRYWWSHSALFISLHFYIFNKLAKATEITRDVRVNFWRRAKKPGHPDQQDQIKPGCCEIWRLQCRTGALAQFIGLDSAHTGHFKNRWRV